MTFEFISLSEVDFNRISDLIEDHEMAPYMVRDIALLSDELNRAQVLELQDVPCDLVTMNSRFRYSNLTDGKEETISLVYPHAADKGRNLISVTAPLGSALLGLKVAEEIDWTFPDGKTKRLKILEILYQPEANRDFHL